MARLSIRLWFCLAVAVIAASVSDFCVELASNAGWFGSGDYTDHSYLAQIPAILIGAVLIAAHLASRAVIAFSNPATVRGSLLQASDRALRSGLGRLLPLTFVLQIAALYAMETVEQYVVQGHDLGGLIWLGGPVLVALAANAIFTIGFTFFIACAIRALARTAIRAILHVLESERAYSDAPVVARTLERVAILRSVPVACRIGERAPPPVFA